MDMRIQTGGARTDVATTDTASRVTPSPAVPFSDVVGRSAGAIARGAEAAVTSLPGAPIVAAAVRGGATPTTTLSGAARPFNAAGFATSGAVLPASLGVGASSPAPTAAAPTTTTGAAATTAAVGSAESPTAAVTGASSSTAGVEQALAQSQDFNLYYLQLQEQMAAENRSYSAMSNVLKSRHDTVKNAIGNIR